MQNRYARSANIACMLCTMADGGDIPSTAPKAKLAISKPLVLNRKMLLLALLLFFPFQVKTLSPGDYTGPRAS